MHGFLRQPARRAALTAALIAVVALAALAALPAVTATPAAAAPTIRYGLEDDAWLLHGPGSLDARLAKLDELGVRLVRFNVHWNEVAARAPAAPTDPDDPAYAWGANDDVLEGLHAHGIAVVLGLVGTPAWANGGRPSNYAPTSASTFAAFATAAARRYAWVRQWLVWNEPNQRRWLLPTTPATYVTRLLNPAYAAIHRELPGAQVGGGVTAPRGVTAGVSPVDWIRGMRAAHARLDAYAHNPYPLNPRRETPLRGGCGHCRTISMANISRLVSEVASNFGRARIWLTEYGYQSNPPDRLLGVSPQLQARYVGEGALAAYRAPRVDMLVHFLYRDEPSVARFQSGLVSLGGAPKLALAAFELPLAQVSRTGSRTRLWGQVRAPGAGATVRLQKRVGAGWRNVSGPIAAGAAGYFGFTGILPRGTQVRVVAGSLTSATIAIT